MSSILFYGSRPVFYMTPDVKRWGLLGKFYYSLQQLHEIRPSLLSAREFTREQNAIFR